jgi:hypothetical protein
MAQRNYDRNERGAWLSPENLLAVARRDRDEDASSERRASHRIYLLAALALVILTVIPRIAWTSSCFVLLLFGVVALVPWCRIYKAIKRPDPPSQRSKQEIVPGQRPACGFILHGKARKGTVTNYVVNVDTGQMEPLIEYDEPNE